MLELVIVAAISAVLFTVLIRWVLTLGAASSMTLDNSAGQRSADVARDAFASDASRATLCAVGEYSPVRTLTPEKVSFTVIGPTGTLDQVTWQLTQTSGRWSLVRKLSPNAGSLDDPCRVSAPTSTKVYADNIDGVQADRIVAGATGLRPGFYAITEGTTITDPVQAWGDCTKHQAADRCSADAVGVNWVFRSPVDKTAPISISRAFVFPTTSKGLS